MKRSMSVLAVLSLMLLPACPGEERSTIHVVGVWTDSEQVNFEKVLDAFAADNKDISVQYHFVRGLRDDLRRRVQNGVDVPFERGGPPDVVLLPQTGTMKELAGAGALVPIEDVVGKAVDRNYTARWRELGSVAGTLYGVWFKAANKSAFWYHVRTLERAGVGPPVDWDGLKTAAGRVVERLGPEGIAPLALGAADAWTLSDWFENVYLRTAGPGKYRDLACGRLPWTDTSVVRALDTMTEVLGQQGWIAGRGAALNIPFTESVNEVFGPRPSAAMISAPDFVAGSLRTLDRMEPGPGGVPDSRPVLGVDARYVSFPRIGTSRDSIVLGGDVAVLMRGTDAGEKLIQFLATPEAAKPWAEAGGFISPNKNVSPSLFSNEFFGLVRPVREAGESNEAEFDLSDQLPPALAQRGILEIFKDYLRDPTNTASVAAQLQRVVGVVDPVPC